MTNASQCNRKTIIKPSLLREVRSKRRKSTIPEKFAQKS